MRELWFSVFFGAVFLAGLCVPNLAVACIWIDGTTLDGNPKSQNDSLQVSYLLGALNNAPERQLEELRSRRLLSGEKSSADEREAVEAMLSGNPEAAIGILSNVEQANPGQYSTAANLGTAYELAGDSENALKWISEGIARNKDSHGGTEWLHQLILETKLRLARDPDYLRSHRVISLPEKFDLGTQVNIGGVDRSVLEISQALNYQLRERLLFVKPPEPVVADLLFTYAEIMAHTAVVESSIQLLELSTKYGFAEPELIQKLMGKYQSAIRRGNAERLRREVSRYLTIALGVVAVGGGLVYWVRWRRRGAAAP